MATRTPNLKRNSPAQTAAIRASSVALARVMTTSVGDGMDALEFFLKETMRRTSREYLDKVLDSAQAELQEEEMHRPMAVAR